MHVLSKEETVMFAVHLAREGLDRQHFDKGSNLGDLPARCANSQLEEQPIEHNYHLATHHN